MNRIRNILRIVFFLSAVVLLVDINRKTDDNVDSIAEFKFKMIEKFQTDSLDSKHKLDMLVNETTKFMDNSSHVRKGTQYLIGLFALLFITELSFFVMGKRKTERQE